MTPFSLESLIALLNVGKALRYMSIDLIYTKKTLNFIQLLVLEGYLLKFQCLVLGGDQSRWVVRAYYRYDNWGRSVFSAIKFYRQRDLAPFNSVVDKFRLIQSGFVFVVQKQDFFFIVSGKASRNVQGGRIVARII